MPMWYVEVMLVLHNWFCIWLIMLFSTKVRSGYCFLLSSPWLDSVMCWKFSFLETVCFVGVAVTQVPGSSNDQDSRNATLVNIVVRSIANYFFRHRFHLLWPIFVRVAGKMFVYNCCPFCILLNVEINDRCFKSWRGVGHTCMNFNKPKLFSSMDFFVYDDGLWTFDWTQKDSCFANQILK